LKGLNAIIDGEIALPVKENGNVLELNKKVNWNKAIFYVFDILEYEGKDIRDMPLVERQSLLKGIIVRIGGSPYVEFVKQFDTFDMGWKHVIDNDFEGLMVKKKDSRYETEALKEYRSKRWFKVKNWKEGKDEIVGHNIRTTVKGSFILKAGTNVNCPDMETLKEYDDAMKNNRKVYAEFYYRFKSKNGFYTPILKRLVIV
jgi:bifunctional non-homologous end joining protein LigD